MDDVVAPVSSSLSDLAATSFGVSALSLSAPSQPASPGNESDSADSDTQPRPRKQRKKLDKYNPPLTSEQRLDILRLHVSEGKTAPTIARLYKDRGFTVPVNTIYTLFRKQAKGLPIDRQVKRKKGTAYKEEDSKLVVQAQLEHND